MAVEVPQTLTAEFFASHPSSPERILASRKMAESLISSGVYVAKPQENAPASAPIAKQGMADEESDDPGPASLPSTTRPELHMASATPPDATLRTLYHELRAGRISQEEYEAKRRELLKGV
jgi:hypothetical protein